MHWVLVNERSALTVGKGEELAETVKEPVETLEGVKESKGVEEAEDVCMEEYVGFGGGVEDKETTVDV